MPDVTPAATAKEAADKKAELDKAMGRASDFKSGPSGVAPAQDAQAATPANQPHDVTKPMGLADHLKALVGMGNPDIKLRNVEEAVDKAVAGVDPNKPGDGY